MDKSYEMLSQDKVFENNIILGYDHDSYEETLETDQDSGESKCTRPISNSDPIDFRRPSNVAAAKSMREKRNGNIRKDIVLGSLNVDDYNTDYVVSSAAGISEKSEIKDFIESSSNNAKVETSVHLSSCVSRTSKDSIMIDDQIRAERGVEIHSCTTNALANVVRGKQLENEPEQKCVTDLEPNSKKRTDANEEQEICFINEEEIECIEAEQVTKETRKDSPFKIKYIEKDSSVHATVSDEDNRPCIENTEPTTVLQNAVGSNLQFLNTGESIVVLTQDVNNIGLPNNMVSQTGTFVHKI